MYRKPHPLRGYLYIAAATFLWGIAATLGRAAFTGRLLPSGEAISEVGPLILSQTRNSFTFLALLVMLGMKRGWPALAVSRGDFARLCLLGVLGISAANFFYYLAIQRTNVATAIMLQYTAPVWVLLYLSGRWRRKPSWQQTVGVILAMTGIAVLIDVFGAGQIRLDQLGVAAGMLSAFAFAFYNVGAHGVLKRQDRWKVLLYVTGSASVFWLLVNPPWKIVAASYSGLQWSFMAVFAVVSALAPFAFYAAGLEHLEPSRAMIAACMEPVFSIGLAAVLLSEFVRPVQLVGVLLVLAAIIAVEWPNRKRIAVGTTGSAMVEPIE